VLLVGILTSSMYFSMTTQAVPSVGYFFKVTILSLSDDQTIANYLAQELRRIRIDSRIVTHPKGAFESAVLSRDFDLVLIDMDWPSKDVDPTFIFSKSGSANYWGIDETMPGGAENEYLLHAAQIASDETERINLYHQWQENLMANILPVVPLYNKISTYSTWGTLVGWNHQEGLIASLPYLEWSSKHNNQLNTSVFIDYTDEWKELNPLFVEDSFYISLIAEPLVRIQSDGTPTPVLAENWNFNSNKTILTINLRDNVYWQPDVDKLYQNELFTTDDVIFTIKMYQNISTTGTYFDWVKRLEKKTDLSLNLIIDGNRTAPGLQPYAPVFAELEKLILPEHYLNVSVGSDGLPDIKHTNWLKYSTYGLGTGMYYFKSYTEGVEVIFNRNENWWGTRADAFNDDLDIWTYKLRFLTDPVVIKLEYQDGKLDIFKHYKKTMDELTVSPFQAQTRSEYDVKYLGFNLKSIATPELGDLTLTEDGTMTKGLAVRKAIAHMINKAQIMDMLEIETETIDSPISNKFGPYVYTGITTYSYNLVKAKEYMLKAGFNPETLSNPGYTFPLAFFSIILTTGIISIVAVKKGRKNEFQ